MMEDANDIRGPANAIGCRKNGGAAADFASSEKLTERASASGIRPDHRRQVTKKGIR